MCWALWFRYLARKLIDDQSRREKKMPQLCMKKQNDKEKLWSFLMEKELTGKGSLRFYINLIAQDIDPLWRLCSWSLTSFCFFGSPKRLFEHIMFSFSKTIVFFTKFLKKEISVLLPWKLLYVTVLRLDKKQDGTYLKFQSSSQRRMQGASPWMERKMKNKK